MTNPPRTLSRRGLRAAPVGAPGAGPALSRRTGAALLAAAMLSVAGCGERLPARPEAEAELLHRILVTEDSRVTSLDQLLPMLEGLGSESPEIRRIAVRALGRLEDPELVPHIGSVIGDADAGVRAEAANALAQAVARGGQEAVRPTLLVRLAEESDPAVRAAIAQSVGRIRHATAADVAGSATAIVENAGPFATGEHTDLRVRIAKGLFLLARQPVARGALPQGAVIYLRSLVRAGDEEDTTPLALQRMRALAIAALAAAGQASGDDVRVASSDPEPFVRREALLAATAVPDQSAAMVLLSRGLEDPSGPVRYEALRGWGRIGREHDCAPVLSAARDASAHVALLAIDLLAGCPGLPGAVELLDSVAASLAGARPPADWHRPAHALASLAALDADRAVERFLPFVASENAFVRAWAARAAGLADQIQTLELLARDADPNVRVVALGALASSQGRAVDPLLVEQLRLDDPQLLMTAARQLRGTAQPGALPALLDALERVSAERRETSRDARLALLDRVGELGSAADSARLAPLLRDFDPAVAARAADVLAEWTGSRPAPAPVAPPATYVPAPAELDALARATFTIEMEGGGSFDLRLLAWEAPTNAHRFARLAEAGYFDGLTYHRVVPNFVIQGGSPAANEYAGDGPFTRDELGLDGNWRGTVGLSTRGRDTGDAQMFINLVDNVRLDHDYTVFAEVVRGMEVVDAVQEGATIRRITRRGGR